jgi:hypothetical protein
MPETLVTDLESIRKAAAEKEVENRLLATAVRNISVAEIDRLAHPLAAEITRQIDCTRCGNCCKVQEPGVSREEIQTLAASRSEPETDFKDKFVAYTSEGAAFLCRQPCIFLDEKICSIYEKRPRACADYPGLERPRLKWRWKQVMENYPICPIVFNMVEQLRPLISSG